MVHGGDFYCRTTATVFMSHTQISMAEKSVSLFLDGTFSTCPAPFKQILILRGKIDNSFHTTNRNALRLYQGLEGVLSKICFLDEQKISKK